MSASAMRTYRRLLDTRNSGLYHQSQTQSTYANRSNSPCNPLTKSKQL